MLRAGASLEEVGQVLRQRNSQVTAVYAKVDFVALRPWRCPGRVMRHDRLRPDCHRLSGVRRSLGYKLVENGMQLPQFVAY